MNFILFAIVVYVMGFLTAIPVGATQVEIAKRSLSGHFGQALMVVLGSVSSDVLYGCIAFFGIAPFMEHQPVMAFFWLVGAVILLVLGVVTLKQSSSRKGLQLNDAMLKSGHMSFLTGFSLAVTNPMMIFWWLMGLQFVKDLSLIDSFSRPVAGMFLLCGGLGLASYLTTLATILHHAKKFVSDKLMQRTYFWLGILLLALSVYFFVRSGQTWFHWMS